MTNVLKGENPTRKEKMTYLEVKMQQSELQLRSLKVIR